MAHLHPLVHGDLIPFRYHRLYDELIFQHLTTIRLYLLFTMPRLSRMICAVIALRDAARNDNVCVLGEFAQTAEARFAVSAIFWASSIRFLMSPLLFFSFG